MAAINRTGFVGVEDRFKFVDYLTISRMAGHNKWIDCKAEVDAEHKEYKNNDFWLHRQFSIYDKATDIKWTYRGYW